MSKWMVYGIAAVADFAAAWVFYSGGRIVVPAVLLIAGLCFVVASVKAARTKATA